jgi:transposase
MGLFLKTVGQYSASTYEVARNLLRSRDTQRERVKELQQRLDQQTQANEQLKRKLSELELQRQLAEQQRDQAQQELQRLREQPLQLPNDPSLPHHSYGPRMISVCIQLAKKIGLRASTEALKIVLDWLSISGKLPDWTTVRTWLCRMGVDALKHARERHDDWICFADHSNQIGKEKVLAVLGVRACHLPPPGQTLCRQHVRVLSLVPGIQWKCEDVAKQYHALSEEIGTPKMLLTDGAVELRESAPAMERDGKKPILLRDLKHFAANALERMIGNTEAFNAVTTSLGRARNAIQQTELSHFTPPSQKSKARFMNLGATLRWCEMVLWHLDHPASDARQGITVDRMDEKLGWLRMYREEIAQWRRIEGVISESLCFINTQGLYRGASSDLQLRLDGLCQASGGHCERSAEMAHSLIEFVSSSESQLAAGERGWLSTEILESAFGMYKSLEGQHSKGGFTSLLASFGALLQDCSEAEVRQSFGRTSVKDVKQWVTVNLGKTLASKKQSAYRRTLTPSPGS